MLFSDFHKVWLRLSVNPAQKTVRQDDAYRFEDMVKQPRHHTPAPPERRIQGPVHRLLRSYHHGKASCQFPQAVLQRYQRSIDCSEISICHAHAGLLALYAQLP